MNLTEKLKYFRHQTGLAQVQTAEGIGISTEYYQHIESGIVEPSAEAMEKIADYFKVDRSFFSDEPKQPEAVKHRPPPAQNTINPPADRYLYRMSSRFLCTAEKCVWRINVGGDCYTCPGGCMKAREEDCIIPNT